MASDDEVVCGRHGTTPAAFTCRHVATGVACGFHTDAGSRSDWPDAICDACAERLADVGEWDDASEDAAGITVLCTHCYEASRERNLDVPPLARGAAVRLSDEETRALVHRAVHHGRAIQEKVGLVGDHGRWDFDVDARTMTFRDAGHATRVADVRLVGSFGTHSQTFQWSWEMYRDDDPLIDGVARLRTFGEVRGISKLVTPIWDAEEVDGWEMTALAGYLLGCDGVYRAPFDATYWFMLLSGWRDAG